MRLDNTITVPADPETVFALVSDPSAVVECLPGATLIGSTGNVHRGEVKIKVGPIVASFEGTVTFVEIDAVERILRLSARGTDSRGNGDAEAEVTVRVCASEIGSAVDIETELMIRGKLAQFGKGAIGAISERLLIQFADNVRRLIVDPVQATVKPTSVSDRSAGQPAPVLQVRHPSMQTAQNELSACALVAPLVRRYVGRAALLGLGFLQGYVLGRGLTIERQLRGRTT